ncbi:cytochrome P450 monooxygenase [Aspergillus ambiguus]|uniref:cytochrome P450 n=1 Tax=Aspergillus ambiguus TaxID=176160 RepID=UPI003CCD4736
MHLQLVPFVSGVLCHVGYFNRGEHHLHGTKYLKVHTVAFLGLAALLYRLGFAPVEVVVRTWVYDGIFLAGLFASLLVYRAFLNPLNVFPGPWMARITSFDLPFRIRKRQLYKTLQALHRQHGHFVRIGTGELSITHPHAVQEIFGADSKCHKSPWYDISRPQDSLLLRRTHAGHAELRRIWSPAFSIKAVQGYEERIQPYRNKLIAGLDAHVGESLDVDHWLALYAWDVMGDLTFGHSFDMLDTRQQHWAIQTLNKGMSVIGLHLPMWVFRILVAIPGGQKDFKLMLKYTKEEMLARWKSTPKVPDVMSHLFAPYKANKPWDDAAIHLMAGESHLLINAGSDTTRTTLACALFELAKNPEYAEKLYETLKPCVSQSSDAEILDSQISTIDLLNGVIWEALRLFPPNPSHPSRVAPAEGVMLCGRFVPGGTQVIAPQYVIGRDEKIYPRATEFIPERWYSAPGLVTDKKATAPFSIGPYNCIGKPLAMMNIRITLARIILRYDLSFAPDRANPIADFEENMSDHFTLQPGPLYLRLEKRRP